jgi:serine/threonine-protein kinase
VHRDVKPANVLLAGGGEEEHAYLSDFGLTRRLGPGSDLTESGQWLGTVDFASPEQLHGERVDAHSDIYSLGCVLFAALTGKPPFPRGTVPATLLAHLHEAPPRPSAAGLPAQLDRVIARALDKEPRRRYPSAGDLGRAAQAAARGESVTESERSVAVGPAAPGAAEATAATAVGVAGPVEATATRPVAAATTNIAPDRRAWSPAHKRRSRRRALAAALALPLAGIVTTAVLLLGQSGDEPARPDDSIALSTEEVRAAAQGFADAYEREDGRALRGLLISDVERVLPTGVARGRSAVMREYERQFRANATRTYELERLQAEGGPAGRVSARYRVTRQAGTAIEGRLVLGVVRNRGRARIALIAVTPRA